MPADADRKTRTFVRSHFALITAPSTGLPKSGFFGSVLCQMRRSRRRDARSSDARLHGVTEMEMVHINSGQMRLRLAPDKTKRD